MCRPGADLHNTTARFPQSRKECVHHGQRAENVHLEFASDGVEWERLDRSGSQDSGVTDEKIEAAIRKAILRYEITHPVVNDSRMEIWKKYGIHSWPTLILIDPEGNNLGSASGEGNFELLDTVLRQRARGGGDATAPKPSLRGASASLEE